MHECIYLGKYVAPVDNQLTTRTHFSIGEHLFCEGLASLNLDQNGLAGSPILKKNLEEVVGVLSGHSTEVVEFKTSSGVALNIEVSNGLFSFVSLIGGSIEMEDKTVLLNLPSIEDQAYQFEVLDPKTRELHYFQTEILNGLIHGTTILRDKSGRAYYIEHFSNGEILNSNMLDLSIYNSFSEEGKAIFVVDEVDEKFVKLVPYSHMEEAKNIALDFELEKFDVVVVPFDNQGNLNWELATKNLELRNFWLNK